MIEIQSDDFYMGYDSPNKTVFLEGELRLGGTQEYAPVATLLNEVIKEVINDNSGQIILNLEKLKFLNSSGISTLSKFVIQIRKEGNIQLVVQASKEIFWQKQSLNNLQKLLPDIHIEYH